MREEYYICKKCGGKWGFCALDCDFKEELYPTICPLCSMPITQMIKEVYVKEGLLETIKRVIGRILN